MNARQKDGGYGTFNNPEMLFQQNYQHLKEYCLIRNITYIDKMFPPDNMSIGLGKLHPDYLAQVKWLRPSESTLNSSFSILPLTLRDAEAMRDFTGGVHICIQLLEPSSDLWKLLCRAGQSKTFMSCCTIPKEEATTGTTFPNGLVPGHAYTVTGLKEVINFQAASVVLLWHRWKG
ncbi:hypothetical protein GOODEAATRI_027166 [Goodea atripinnis]|uniref:Calpain catalytic domain-containing protein n=1 Tax=Goodea atripinnis TaxID=208336 RepID=A0ABV0N4N4_9TELE